MATVVGNPTHKASMADRVASMKVVKAAEGALADGRAAFKAKPYQTAAAATAYLSTALHIIAAFAPWWSYTASLNNGDIRFYGHTSLFDARYCTRVSSLPTGVDPKWVSTLSCGITPLLDIAPVLDYFHTAGAVAFTFLLLGLAPSALAAYLTGLKRLSRDSARERLHPLLHPVLELRSGVPALHATAAACHVIAFGTYAGLVSTSIDLSAVKRVFDVTPNIAASNFSGGFGACVTAFVFAVAAAVLTALYPQEASRTGPDAPSTAAVASAMGDIYAAGLAGSASGASSGGGSAGGSGGAGRGGVADWAGTGGSGVSAANPVVAGPYYSVGVGDGGIVAVGSSNSSSSSGGGGNAATAAANPTGQVAQDVHLTI